MTFWLARNITSNDSDRFALGLVIFSISKVSIGRAQNKENYPGDKELLQKNVESLDYIRKCHMEYIEECFIIFNNTSGEMHETVNKN